jgi:hypothetical protein
LRSGNISKGHRKNKFRTFLGRVVAMSSKISYVGSAKKITNCMCCIIFYVLFPFDMLYLHYH